MIIQNQYIYICMTYLSQQFHLYASVILLPLQNNNNKMEGKEWIFGWSSGFLLLSVHLLDLGWWEKK
ncbi:uncharacterized protein BX664DRAFT_342126 [Halteromyces radiatus]|uniref:uncharacterized protein n=1 Tax=Halteromyces radiatus TaxID=101107 RepID=UPI00221EAE16|nr:uncharacterized protein BX664DRAFT_342126 [Halteromyces radiatus]KAI8080030.1 hypothetical protein BX664DRAFT_342126 [Halteromyces radiatus]